MTESQVQDLFHEFAMPLFTNKWQKKAIELTPKDKKEEYKTRLELYEDGKPYREEVKSG